MFDDLTSITAEIVSAHISNNSLRSNDLPDLLKSIHESLLKVISPEPE